MTESQSYRRPAALFNSHLETIYPSLFRKPKVIEAKRERISTPDQDFWILIGTERAPII